MDDSTAYRILNIKEGTDIKYIAQRYDHFVKLYRQYLMGVNTGLSPERIEEMKEAYEHLLYKRISDAELIDLYPREKNDMMHKLIRKCSDLLVPYWEKYRAGVIYAAITAIAVCIIILILNYKPVDLDVAILRNVSDRPVDRDLESMMLESFENEIKSNVPGIGKMKIIYALLDDADDQLLNNIFLVASDADVCLMERTLLEYLQPEGKTYGKMIGADEAFALDAYKSEGVIQDLPFIVPVSEKTKIYKNLCSINKYNEQWVAVMPSYVRHRVQAIDLLKYLSGSE